MGSAYLRTKGEGGREGDCGSKGATKQTLPRSGGRGGRKEKRKGREGRKRHRSLKHPAQLHSRARRGGEGGEGRARPGGRGRPGRPPPRRAPGREAAAARPTRGGTERRQGGTGCGGKGGVCQVPAGSLPPVSPPSLTLCMAFRIKASS